jgi:hypothetical protein
MATLTVHADLSPELVAALDGVLVIDDRALAGLVRAAVWRISENLGRIAEDGDEIVGDDLRTIASLLSNLAEVLETGIAPLAS